MKACIEYFQSEKIEGRILELGCGDLNFARNCGLLDLDYTGIDIQVKKTWKSRKDVIEADILDFDYSGYDIIICRDVMIHLTNDHVLRIINKVRKAAPKRFYATTYPGACNYFRKFSPSAGSKTLDLTQSPFMFPEPDYSVHETPGVKFLSIWSKYE